MSARLEIEPALARLIDRLRMRRADSVDRATVDALRSFGIEVLEIGMQIAHSQSTIPAPDPAGRYSIQFDDDTEIKP